MDERDKKLWEQYCQAYNAHFTAEAQFLAHVSDLVGTLEYALKDYDSQRLALYFTKWFQLESSHPRLKTEDMQRLLGSLIAFASTESGSTSLAQDLILTLPKEWLIENIEKYANPILENGDDMEYSAILTLFSFIDDGLTRKLAERALTHEDKHVRDAGEFFLNEVLQDTDNEA